MMKRRHLHPLYSTWKEMRKRCRDKTAKNWHRYGGRGISICARWNDFWAFVLDMGERPEHHTLDRINNDLGYSPENCMWATMKEQSRNTCRTKLTIENVQEIRDPSGHLSLKELASKFNISYGYAANVRCGVTWK